MKCNKKNSYAIVLCCSLFLFLTAFGLLAVLCADQTYSRTERRRLAQKPELSVSSFFQGNFQEDAAEYLPDQFPLREVFRSAKALFVTYVLGQSDTNDLVQYQGGLYQISDALQENRVVQNADNFSRIRERYFPDAMVYYAVIPDKNYFLPEGTCPRLDYEKLYQLMNQHMTDMQEISIAEYLELSDYYRTDLHWKQEELLPAAEALLTQMNVTDSEKYDIITFCEEFYGAYYGQAALPCEPDTLCYLTNESIKQAKVIDFEKGSDQTGQMYELNSMTHIDPYDLYLNGPRAILEIENPGQHNGRELFLFRDSFGSSMAPLLIGGYERVTLIDLRYVSADLLGNYIKFPEDCDVLFLYNTSLLNSNSLSMLQ